MDKNDINKLRELPIEGVAERLGLRVAKHKALCPFHEDSHPSLTFNIRKNTYKCFVCDAHGGVIDLAMNLLVENTSFSPISGGARGGLFLEACQWLANENNIILASASGSNGSNGSNGSREADVKPFDASRYERFFEHPYLSDAASRFLFDERKLDPRVVRWCRLSSYRDRNGIPWLQIPYYDIDCRLIGVQSRNLDYKKEPLTSNPSPLTPRFRFPKSSRCHIYNLPVLNMLKPNEPLFITEGASDCWAMLSSGHKAIAIPSATLLNRKDIQLLKDVSQRLEAPLNLHMYPDADAPGEKLYSQLVHLANEIGACITHHSLPDDCKDYSDYYIKKQRK